ncbi:hypothetical protein NDU88_000982 [Pleurodeles waltl]|uniref:Uncharacterized protein n=1 Tax=Pleurodeles waltl TaxID=8319 RepID=A0AAV7WJI8_PLEWA|nr:hypothetical protein NDU88_000982 [Pleurodeles waltl]
MCNRSSPDAGFQEDAETDKEYPGAARGSLDVMTSNVMYVREETGRKTAHRERETNAKGDADRNADRGARDATERILGKTSREGAEREDAHPNEARPQPTGEPRRRRETLREPPAPDPAKSGDYQEAGRVPGGAWPPEVLEYALYAAERWGHKIVDNLALTENCLLRQLMNLSVSTPLIPHRLDICLCLSLMAESQNKEYRKKKEELQE